MFPSQVFFILWVYPPFVFQHLASLCVRLQLVILWQKNDTPYPSAQNDCKQQKFYSVYLFNDIISSSHIMYREIVVD
jgi:hypothetical protein